MGSKTWGILILTTLMGIGHAAPTAPAIAPQPVASANQDRTAARARVYAYVASRGGSRAARTLTPLIVAHAERQGLPPLLVAKVINRESSFRATAENRKCFGLMQVAHFHFQRGENPRDPATNLAVGCRLLSSYHKRFRSWPQALTAYNFGPAATERRGLSTSRYARLVMAGR